MNRERMTGAIETERLVLFPYTQENLHLFNNDLARFEETFGVRYYGEELDYLLTDFLKKLEREIADDPETLARDLGVLTKGGYRVRRIRPVDMFPHTEHIETVCFLTRKA